MSVINLLPWRRASVPAPVLDGPFSPNQKVDLATLLDGQLAGANDVAVHDGQIVVSQGTRIVRITGRSPAAMRSVVYELPGKAGGLFSCRDGGLLVCVEGIGVFGLDGTRDGWSLTQVDGIPLGCATSVIEGADGRIFITDASQEHALADWEVDWARKGRTGRVIAVDPRERSAYTVADGLQFPYGIAQRPRDGALVVTESWRCGITLLRPSGRAWTKPESVASWLPGYPARIINRHAGGYWVSFLSVRNQLLDFVLREERFLRRMIGEVPRRHWVSPALAPSHEIEEAGQLGGIKLGGISTAWAPSRSYGLIARLDDDFEVVESLHSRSDGERHGITGLREEAGDLYFVSMGHGKLMMHEEGGHA
jgi:hypothetical protein